MKPIDFENLRPAPEQDNECFVWRCGCSNTLFEIRPDGILCHQCGAHQYPYDNPKGCA